MAQFFGLLKGTRGEATRLGSKSSGLVTEACSYQGKIVTVLRHDDFTGKDVFEVRMERHQGAGDYMVIATGVVGDAMSIKPCEVHAAVSK